MKFESPEFLHPFKRATSVQISACWHPLRLGHGHADEDVDELLINDLDLSLWRLLISFDLPVAKNPSSAPLIVCLAEDFHIGELACPAEGQRYYVFALKTKGAFTSTAGCGVDKLTLRLSSFPQNAIKLLSIIGEPSVAAMFRRFGGSNKKPPPKRSPRRPDGDEVVPAEGR